MYTNTPLATVSANFCAVKLGWEGEWNWAATLGGRVELDWEGRWAGGCREPEGWYYFTLG